MNLGQHIGLVPDKAVGHEGDVAGALRVLRELERRLNTGDHLRPSAGLEAFDLLERVPHVLGRRRDRRREESLGGSAEANHLERVAHIHMRQCVACGGPFLGERLARLAPGDVDREHHLQRLAGKKGRAIGRDEHQREVPARTAAAPGQ